MFTNVFVVPEDQTQAFKLKSQLNVSYLLFLSACKIWFKVLTNDCYFKSKGLGGWAFFFDTVVHIYRVKDSP